MSNVRKEIETINATSPLTAVDSGKVFMVGGGAGIVITLPAATTAGLIFKFILVDSTNLVTISSPTANIYGVLSVQSGTNRIACAGETSVVFAANALIGDSIEFISNGVNYYATGFGAHAASFTTA